MLPYELWFGAALAGASGAALLAYGFVGVPMTFTAPFVVLPSALIVAGLMLVRTQRYERLHVMSRRLLMGVAWALAATVVYDVSRPLIVLILGFSLDPYRAMPIFGQLITGLPAGDPLSLTAGWIYHIWNGVSFGLMYALVWPRGGAVGGWIWAMALQGLRMVTYPNLFQARVDDPPFLITGILGHSLWGVVLGVGLRRTIRHA